MLGSVAGAIGVCGELAGCGNLPSAGAEPGGTPKSWANDAALDATVAVLIPRPQATVQPIKRRNRFAASV